MYLAREEVLSAATHGFISCCGDARGTGMETLCWRIETGRYAARPP